ncbi:hypothetical protein [Rubrivirga sp.]|uniref:hypothetical protein n=1 Tax=Rubrivirga sp. TaxID=1885344 RepID=UPI003B525D20
MRRAARALALAALAAAPALAQTDTTATVRAAPVDSLAPPVATVGPGRAPVGPFPLVPGRPITPVPATTAALDLGLLVADPPSVADLAPAALVAPTPAVFAYRLGATGRTAGLALDGLDPATPGLLLDGRPLLDLVTDAPRFDLLPLAAMGPLRIGDGALGRATSAQAGLRDLRVGVPVTELRYLGGQDGIQHVSGLHAQTRRPPAFLRGGSDASRLTLTGHAASRTADGPRDGADLAHTDAFGRLLLTRPSVAAEVGVSYTDRTEGARAGVVPTAGLPITAIFSPATSQVLGSGATRRTLRTEPWLRLRLPFVMSAPTEVGGSVAVQRSVFVPADGTGDTVRVHGRRLAAYVAQRVPAGAHALGLRLDVAAAPAPGPETGALPGADARLGLHAAVTDSVRLGPAEVALGAGVHQVDGERWPSASARATVGALSAGVRLGGRARSWLERVGLEGRVVPDASDGTEQTLAADAAVALRRGDGRLGVCAFASRTTDGRHLVAVDDTLFAVVGTEGAVAQGGVAVSVGWRESARRGVYVRADGTARVVSDPSSDLRSRLDAALPRVWGTGRVGLRAEDVGDGVLDLDLAVVAQAWTAFRSRRVEQATGALALPVPGAALGAELPARALVGLEATATFSARASLFVRYDHALGERAVDAVLVQGEPLPPHVLRFGVFWALLN